MRIRGKIVVLRLILYAQRATERRQTTVIECAMQISSQRCVTLY